MREDNKRMWEVLMAERRKNERITGLLRTVWDVVGKGFPGSSEYALLMRVVGQTISG